MQHKIYWGPLKKPIEWSLKTWLAPWAYMASVVYHDIFWYPLNGKARMQEALDSDWGRLFHNWETAHARRQGFADVGQEHLALQRTGARALLTSVGLLGTALKEAPEVAERLRHMR